MSCMLLSQECCNLSSVTRKQSETVDSKKVCWAWINTCSSLFWPHWSYRKMFPTLICTSWLVYINKILSFSYPAALLPPLFALKSTVPSLCPLPFLLQTIVNSHPHPAKKPKINKSSIFLHSIPPPPTWSLRALFLGAGLRPSHQRPVQVLQQQCHTLGWARGTGQRALYPCEHSAHVVEVRPLKIEQLKQDGDEWESCREQLRDVREIKRLFSKNLQQLFFWLQTLVGFLCFAVLFSKKALCWWKREWYWTSINISVCYILVIYLLSKYFLPKLSQ